MSGRVLFVDDHDDSVLELTRLVLGKDYEVSMAESLPDAVRRLSESPFDLIITEALEQFNPLHRFDPAFLQTLAQAARGVPIILCSGDPGIPQRKLHQWGVVAFIPKPFRVEQMEAEVRRVVAGAKDRTTD